MTRSRARMGIRSSAILAAIGMASSAAASDPGEEPAPAPPPISRVEKSFDYGECDPLFEDDCDESNMIQAHFPDPWEPYNRGVFVFNSGFDRFVLNPLTSAYKAILPDPIENAILRVVDNLDAPSIMINDGLQLEWWDAARTLERFVLNSTLGLGGLFDPAAALGIEGHHSDFGQTLTLAGMPSGPYIIIPVFGPSTLRDGGGAVADIAMSPMLYVLGPLTFEIWRQGGSGIAIRADAMRDLKALERESIDYYAALRSAFYQNRQAQIWSNREHRREAGGARPAAATSEAAL